MHAQQETWFADDAEVRARDAGSDRDDPTLVWTGTRALDEPFETAPSTSPTAALVVWNLIAALGLCGAVLIMRVLVVAAPAPQSNARAKLRDARAHAALAVESSPAITTTRTSTPDPDPAIDDGSVREVEPTRKSAAPAHSRASAKKPMRAVANGTLRINSLPWAEVYLDGALVGNTPKPNLSIKPGRHRVKLVNQPMAMSKTFVVQIRPGEVITRSENLSP
jgi:hypothetical protein